MTKRLFVLLFCCVALVFSACAKKEKPVIRLQTQIEASRDAWSVYFEYPDQLEKGLEASYGLREVRLTEPVRAFNCLDARKNRWEEIPLSIGTKVLVGKENIPVYKADCRNKLFIPVVIKRVPVMAAAAPIKTKSGNGFWAGVWQAVKDAMGALLWLILILIGLAILGAVGYGIYRLVQRLRHRPSRPRRPWHHATRPPMATPVTPSAPTAPTTPVTPPAPATPPATTSPVFGDLTILVTISPYSGRIRVNGDLVSKFSVAKTGKKVILEMTKI